MKQSHIKVTERIIERSRPTGEACLQRVDAMIKRPVGSDRLGCANVARAFAAMPAKDKFRIYAEKARHAAYVAGRALLNSNSSTLQ